MRQLFFFVLAIYSAVFFVCGDDDGTLSASVVRAPDPTGSSFTCMQYNIQLRASCEGLLHQLFGIHSSRSHNVVLELPRLIGERNPDIVCFNELFTLSLREPLARNMLRAGYTHCTCTLNSGWDLGEFVRGKLWPGGVMVFSRFLIERYVTMQYSRSAHADSYSAKGVLYAKINKHGTPYHVFATHTNASYSRDDDTARTTRAHQFREMARFIASFNIARTEAVLIVGDLNVASGSTEYSKMLELLHAHDPPRHDSSWPHSYDASSNSLVILEENSVTPPATTLDYILYSADHLQPVHAANTIVNLKGPAHVDISDHYPVLARFAFPVYIDKLTNSPTRFVPST